MEGVPRRILSGLLRYVGPIPEKGASRLERLRVTRRLGLKLAVPFIPILILGAIASDQIWAYVVPRYLGTRLARQPDQPVPGYTTGAPHRCG